VFTREVEEWLEWFALTHQLQGGMGWLAWQRTALPVAGGVGDQPAKVMEALTVIAREENAALQRRGRASRRGEDDRPRRRRG